MDTITSTQITNHGSYYGALISCRVLSVPEQTGALALEFHAGDAAYAESRHLVLTDARQLLELAAHIRHILLPTMDQEILDALGRIEKKLEQTR